MKISYNVTGARRKSLVEAISHIQRVPAKYLGAPSFAYEVGGFTIDKTGTVTGSDYRVLVSDLESKLGFIPVAAEYDIPIPRDAAADDGNALTIEVPLDGFSDAAFGNLEKLVAGKAGLIKKALGAGDLTIEKTEDRIRFPWFTIATPEENDAYVKFIAALCAAAKEQKRVTAKEKPVDNEKFAFRVFLIRLGFVGDAYKTARKILLRNLTGNAAFKHDAPQKANESEAADNA